jgi:uracil-DNA glycosylase family 4
MSTFARSNDVDPHKIYVPGIGPRHPKIVIVGEAPSYDELQALKPFVGPSGKLLDGLLRDAGINRGDCWVTNVCKYFVPPSPKKKQIPFKVRAKNVGIDLDQSISELRMEIHALQPNVIVALGATALYALTGKEGIQDYRGSILEGMGYKVIPSYHPAHILHSSGESTGQWNKQILAFDLKRAYEQSQFKDFRLPHRNLQVIKNSAELYSFLDLYKDAKYPSVDIEAYQCVPICIGIAYTKSHGITIPLWNKFNISDIPTYDLVNCWRILADHLASTKVVGQNFGYDRDKLRRLGFKVAGIKSDTLLKAFCINPELPKNLAFLTSLYTQEPFYKNEGMYEGSTNDLLIGCARDACVTKEVDDAMDVHLDELEGRDYYEKFLLPLQGVYAGIEAEGFRVDEEKRKALIRKYIEWDEKLRYEIFELAGEHINVNSHVQVGRLLYEKLGIPAREGTGEEQLTAIINQSKNQQIRLLCEKILENRRVRKTTSTYLYCPTDFDGRMRTSYFICLNTGRSSTNQQDPPIRPDVEYVAIDEGKKTKKRQARGMAFQTITKHGDIGSDIRTMLVVDEGHVFLQADSSQAEARVIFHLAEDYEALKLIDEIDYHALTASWFFGGDWKDHSKAFNNGQETPIRFAGKTLRHACHLGAKAKRAAITVNTDARKAKIPFTITESKAEDAIRIFHARQPKIRGIFQNGVIKALEKSRQLRAPVPYGIDAKVEPPRTFFGRWDDDLFREAFSYIPQRTVSENTKGAALRIKGSAEHAIPGRAPWIRIHVESHDALLVSIPIERKLEAAKILKEELERPIDFAACSLERGKLIIPCEVEEGYDYKNLSKFKDLK